MHGQLVTMRNPEFREHRRRANLTNELGPLNALRQMSHKHWRAAAWLLEGTNPQRFAKQPIKIIKPEDYREIVDLMFDVVTLEVRDPDVLDRIGARLEKIEKDAEREAWAIQYDPLHKPRRAGKRATRPPTPPWEDDTHPQDGACNAQHSK